MPNATQPISNFEDMIDSRDIIARINYLEISTPAGECYEDEREELDTLRALARNGEDYADDWRYGEALIRDSYFETYAQELAEDCGMVENSTGWPNGYVDWEQAADELKMDYTPIEFDGVTYWIR